MPLSLEKDLNHKIEAKCNAFKMKFQTGSFPPDVTEKTLDDEIRQAELKCQRFFRDLNGDMDKFAGVAFISFRTEAMKRLILKAFPYRNFQRLKVAFQDLFFSSTNNEKSVLTFHKKQLLISQAPNPLDVCWINLGIGDKERFIREFLGHCLTLGLIICTATLLYIIKAQMEVLEESYDLINLLNVEAMNLLISIGIVLINWVLSALVPLIVQ